MLLLVLFGILFVCGLLPCFVVRICGAVVPGRVDAILQMVVVGVSLLLLCFVMWVVMSELLYFALWLRCFWLFCCYDCGFAGYFGFYDCEFGVWFVFMTLELVALWVWCALRLGWSVMLVAIWLLAGGVLGWLPGCLVCYSFVFMFCFACCVIVCCVCCCLVLYS